MNARLERVIRNNCGIHVNEIPGRMLSEQVPAADAARLAIALLCLVIGEDVLAAARNGYGSRLP
jgi:hypothetical protein